MLLLVPLPPEAHEVGVGVVMGTRPRSQAQCQPVTLTGEMSAGQVVREIRCRKNQRVRCRARRRPGGASSRGLGSGTLPAAVTAASSRAQCLAYLVCSPTLLASRAWDVEEMLLIGTLCALVEEAGLQTRAAA